MNQTRNHRLHLVASFAAVTALAVVTTAQLGPAVADQAPAAPAQTTRCEWTTDQLPRTPDAVEGWYRGCRTSALPSTPDAIEAWTN